MGCCSSYVDLGCFDACSAITLTGYTATQTGAHTFEAYLVNGAKQDVDVTFTSGDTFAITANTLNESKQHDVRIKQPDGTYYEFDTDIDCARITTEIHY